jgi:ribosomal protein S2
MEKGCSRMGVVVKFNVSSKQLSKGFLASQSHWGHTKQILNHSLSAHIIGTKNDFVIFNSAHFTEYSKRCSIFCSNVILDKGNILFINFGAEYKKLTVFFGSRSLQPMYAHEWVGGSITNNFLKKPTIILTHNIPKDSFILKEASKRFIPIITIEDSDYSLNKSFYSSFGNDNNKDSMCYFYSILSESIIKSLLLVHAKNFNPTI